jgi:hypothetical protein
MTTAATSGHVLVSGSAALGNFPAGPLGRVNRFARPGAGLPYGVVTTITLRSRSPSSRTKLLTITDLPRFLCDAHWHAHQRSRNNLDNYAITRIAVIVARRREKWMSIHERLFLLRRNATELRSWRHSVVGIAVARAIAGITTRRTAVATGDQDKSSAYCKFPNKHFLTLPVLAPRNRKPPKQLQTIVYNSTPTLVAKRRTSCHLVLRF